MRTSILFLSAFAALTSADIICDAPIATGALYWSPATSLNYTGQIGVLETRGNAELLATYPNSNVIAHSISVIPCNSTFLNASNPDSSSSATTNLYVKLQLVDDESSCLGLEAIGGGSVFLIKQACDQTETDAQSYQFWLRDAAFGAMYPVGGPQPAKPDTLQFNSGDAEEVISSPDPCSGGNGCQNGEHIAFVIKDV
jgi:hypothetical protein